MRVHVHWPSTACAEKACVSVHVHFSSPECAEKARVSVCARALPFFRVSEKAPAPADASFWVVAVSKCRRDLQHPPPHLDRRGTMKVVTLLCLALAAAAGKPGKPEISKELDAKLSSTLMVKYDKAHGRKLTAGLASKGIRGCPDIMDVR